MEIFYETIIHLNGEVVELIVMMTQNTCMGLTAKGYLPQKSNKKT
jgi:hypothetical protein